MFACKSPFSVAFSIRLNKNMSHILGVYVMSLLKNEMIMINLTSAVQTYSTIPFYYSPLLNIIHS